MKRCRLFYGVLVMLLMVVVAGCGDSGHSTVSGVAAAGAPIVGTVYLKDSAIPAQERFAVIAADGSFSFDLGELTPPFLLKAVGTVNGSEVTLYSFAGQAGIANINPLAHLAVALANGSDNLAGLYAAADPPAM